MVSAIILNYLNPELTATAVQHLTTAAAAAEISVEVIVVDNSAPQTAEELRQLLPNDVKIIENEANKGFAAANNQGIKEAKGEVIIIMNNDLFINKKVLKAGVKYIMGHKKTGIWAPKLVGQSGNEQRSCFNFPAISDLINEYLFNNPSHTMLSLKANAASTPVPVDSVIGACMFIRKKTLQEVGLFDERFFFNSEDLDLCYKLHQRGYNIIFDPTCEAVHLCSASQNNKWYQKKHLHQSRKIYWKKHYHPFKAKLAGSIIAAGLMMRKFKDKALNL